MSLWFEKNIFYALIFCLPLQVRHIFYSFGRGFNEWLSLSLFATDILVLALLWLWLWRSRKRLFNQERPAFSWRQPEIWLVFWLLVSLFSIALADNKWLGFYSWLRLIELAGLFLYVKSNVNKIFNLKIFWRIYIAGAILQSLVAIAQFFKQQSLGLKWLGESPLSPDIDGVAKIMVDGVKMIRSYGLTPHPNILAAILIVAIFGLTWLFIQRNSKKDFYFFGVIFVVFLAALFFTFSRSIMIIGGMIFIFWLTLLWKQKEIRKKIGFVILLFFVGYLSLVAYYWPIYANRFSTDNLVGGQSANLRIYYNQVAVKLISSSPLIGIGQGNFVNNFSQHYSSLEAWVFQPVHNIYLLMASETGLIGVLAFLFFVFSIFSGVLKNKQFIKENCFLYIFCFIMLVGLVDHFWWDLQQGQLLFWLTLGLMGAHSSMDRAQASEA